MTQLISNIAITHIASLFILSGAAKLFAVKQFLHYVIQFKILPRKASLLFGSLLPVFEITGGFLLLQQQTWNSGAAILALLLLGFGIGILKVLNSGKIIQCGCYGKWLNTETDYFTLCKTVYLFLLLLFVSYTIPGYGISLSPVSAAAGILLTVLLIISNAVWQAHKNTSRQLRQKT